MAINHEAFELAKRNIGLKESPGAENNPLIVLMHALTTYKAKEDSVSWCASAMNFWITVANMRRRPDVVLKQVKKMGLTEPQMQLLIGSAMLTNEIANPTHMPLPTVDPTWSAAAKSWKDWGISVKNHPVPGDICVFTRGSQGGHVAFYYSNAGFGMMNCLGGNQSDSVCIQRYTRLRLLDIRRSII